MSFTRKAVKADVLLHLVKVGAAAVGLAVAAKGLRAAIAARRAKPAK